MMHINEARCKGCGLCVRACPLKLMKLSDKTINANGYHPAYLSVAEKCVSCCACALTCPDMCIEITEDK